ncbi:MAG: hypothetical protein JNL02_12420 [Saprospiraceae bacterium]|nr:hypothetical protein [Saprospiraceae bacterium]
MENLFQYEHRRHPLLPRHKYYGRLAKSLMAGVLILSVSLLLGTAGYHYTCFADPDNTIPLGWLDSMLNAAMILSGMGPLVPVEQMSDWGKYFAAGYAIFSGVVFISTIGIILAPAAHRMLHRFHLEEEKKTPGDL